MENRKYVKFLIPFFVLGFFVFNISNVFAYDTETHAFLTSEIVKFYNKNFSNNLISNDLMPYLVDGSRREDDIPRWMNHFYDPVYNRGLTYDPKIDPKPINILIEIGTWQTSKDWAQSGDNQNQLIYKTPIAIASILTAIQQGKISALTAETDFTWQQAIKFYSQGDKEKAIFLLGHILHLIEDTSVPDHTRNDPHPGDSPYEIYTSQFNFTNPDKNLDARLNNKTPVVLADLNSYFDELATYSNKNFYSKDTIGTQSGYNLPDSLDIRRDGNSWFKFYSDSESADYHLVQEIKPTTFNYLVDNTFNLSLIDPNNLVLSDYWSRLSTKSVEYGAGVINLFLQQAEAAKNSQNTSQEKSFFSQVIDSATNLVNQVGNFFFDIFGNSQNLQPVGQVSLDQNVSQTLNVEQQSNQELNQTQTTNQQTNQTSTTNKPKTQPTKQQTNQVQTDQQLTDNQDENLQDQQVILENSSTSQSQTNQSQIISASANQCSFSITQSPSHQGIIINEVAWMGAQTDANDEWIELKNISAATVDINNWQLLDQAEHIKINLASINGSKLIKSGQFILLERTDDNSVPNITADLIYTGAISNTNEGLRLFDNQCNLIDEVLANPNWPAGDNSAKKTMERGSTSLTTSDFNWHTSNDSAGTPKKENSAPTVVYSSNGNTSNSNPPPAAPNNSPASSNSIIINEIMYDLQSSDDGREWIEIFNNGNSSVDLTNWKFYENQTNHGLTVIQGTANLSSAGYAVIVEDPQKFLADNPNFSSTILKASFSLSNTGEDIAIKNGDTIIDEINYSSSWGAAGDGNSLQKINSNWQASQPTPGQANKISGSSNQAPGAFFVYTPSNPQVGDLITFNAASSSDSDGNIALYEWNFGDNTTSTVSIASTTHIYSQTGNYQISLIVFDNQNTSSTATSTIIAINSFPSAGVNHLVISEIMPGTADNANNEFVELYNPTDNAVNLSNWSLERKVSQTATSTKNLVLSFDAISTIAGKSFFLIAHNDYNGTSTPDFRYTNNSDPLAHNDDVVVLYNSNDEIIDEIAYQNIEVGKSLERKAFGGGLCVSASGDGEFLGNGCDTDNADDFEIRNTPNPQNSFSLPEPRNAPMAPENFNIQYSSSTMELVFDWQPSQDYSGSTSTLTYKITDISQTSSTLSTIETTSTTATISISETGRDYTFSIISLDKDGLESIAAEKEITVPSPAPTSQIVLRQENSDSKSSPIESIYYLQYLGNNLSLTVKSFEIYGESNQNESWQGGICEKAPDQFFYQCPSIGALTIDVISNEVVSEAGVKTLITFTFPQSIVLTPGNYYSLYIRPYGGANFYAQTSVYGSSIDTYLNGFLSALEYIPGYGGNSINLDISDMYFVLKSP